jgi:hypothetical protein
MSDPTYKLDWSVDWPSDPRGVIGNDALEFDTKLFTEKLNRDIADAFGLPAELLNTNSNGHTTAVQMKMREAERAFRAAAAVPRLRLIEDPIAALPGPPVRTYPKRKARSDRHWRRMNKKWLKRYGITWVPTAYQMDLGWEILIIVHPALAPEYRAAIDKAFPQRS